MANSGPDRYTPEHPAALKQDKEHAQALAPGGIRDLDDPQLIRRWSALRVRIALSGKAVPGDLKREYAAVSAEYRRRMKGDPRP